MAFTRGQFRNFTRELEVGTRGLTGPDASQRLAAMARAHIADVERQQAARSGGVVPDHTTTVDGRPGTAPEQLRPDGVILIAWHYLTEAVIRTVTYLEENGPERKGGWPAPAGVPVLWHHNGSDAIPSRATTQHWLHLAVEHSSERLVAFGGGRGAHEKELHGSVVIRVMARAGSARRRSLPCSTGRSACSAAAATGRCPFSAPR